MTPDQLKNMRVPMNLTPDQIKDMRRRDAIEVRARLSEAEHAVASLQLGIGVWADSVRATAELRYGADAADAVLWADPGYSRALNAVREAELALVRVTAVKHEFHLEEGETDGPRPDQAHAEA
jgi:hypothetical protein